jgi:hypothetical protein
VLLVLFVPDEEVVYRNEVGAELVDNAHPFVSRLDAERFLGYLNAQKAAMTGETGAHTNRPELVAVDGYDIKYAMHALRLGLQGVELLTTGRITLPVPEPHRTYLRSIRRGEVAPRRGGRGREPGRGRADHPRHQVIDTGRTRPDLGRRLAASQPPRLLDDHQLVAGSACCAGRRIRELMTRFRVETEVLASAGACFELSLSVDAHTASMRASGERAVTGVTHGHLVLGETVTWQARHFGVRFRMTSAITAYAYPSRFVDEQVHGPSQRWWHEHTFVPQEREGTLMIDSVEYEPPLGPVGAIVDRAFLGRTCDNSSEHATRG